MLLQLAASLFAIFLLVCITEGLWRSGNLKIETSRKIVHIGTGIIVAFWPLYLSWEVIQAVSVLLLLVILISYKFKIFKAIHTTDRLTVGEILYPVAIGISAFLEPTPWVFTAAILNLTLADGLAAIVGTKYGKSTRYTIMSQGKSLIGSATFFVVAFIVLVASTFFVDPQNLPNLFAWYLWAALVLTVVENISWYGLDDLTVPLATIVLLTVLPT